ncbi:hypothetical protein [Blautia sp.]
MIIGRVTEVKKDGRLGLGNMNSSYNLPEEWRQKIGNQNQR